MSSCESDADPDVVYVSSDSEDSVQEANADDDAFVSRAAPSAEDLELSKRTPSPKRENDPVALEPGPNEHCAICLQEYDALTVLSGCYHRFCFTCILHWSQVSPTCPLCKKQIGYLMFDITKDGQYRTFYPRELASATATRTSGTEKFPTEAHRRRKTVYTKGLERIPLPKKRVVAVAAGGAQQQQQQQPLVTEPLWDQRVGPWARRELQAILSEEDVTLLLLIVRSLVVLKPMPAYAELKEKMQDFLFEHAERFVGELEAFISSGLDMPLYDRLVDYRSTATSAAAGVGHKRSHTE